MKLSRMPFTLQCFTQFAAWFFHQCVFLHPAFDDKWLDAVGTRGVDDQFAVKNSLAPGTVFEDFQPELEQALAISSG
jgi:hypothetical protein